MHLPLFPHRENEEEETEERETKTNEGIDAERTNERERRDGMPGA